MGLVMLDLDGTLVEDAIVEYLADGGGFLEQGAGAPGDYKTVLGRRQYELYTEPTLKPNVYETLKRHADEGDAFAIVTNQGGVALGYHTQAEVYGRIAKTCALLSMFWGRPFSVHVAWMMPKGYVPGFKGDDGRKPADTMLIAAIKAAGFDNAAIAVDALMVGDRPEDEAAAAAAGVDYRSALAFFGL